MTGIFNCLNDVSFVESARGNIPIIVQGNLECEDCFDLKLVCIETLSCRGILLAVSLPILYIPLPPKQKSPASAGLSSVYAEFRRRSLASAFRRARPAVEPAVIARSC